MSKPKIISEPLEVGTRAFWDDLKQVLYFVDVPSAFIYRYRPSNKRTTRAKVDFYPCPCPCKKELNPQEKCEGTGEPLAFAFPIAHARDEFIAGLGRKFITFKWDGECPVVTKVKLLGEVDEDKPNNRLNGGKVDPTGRLWAGTMGEEGPDGNIMPGRGSLYSVTKGKIKKHQPFVGISNGLAWNMSLRKMYYIDTLFLGVYQYDYDSDSGNISNRRVIYRFLEDGIEGSPDGLTIDTYGSLYVSVIFGSQIIKISPNGELLKSYSMPTPEITSLCFGGKNLETLFITSAKMRIKNEEPPYPAGCTFEMNEFDAKGLPDDRYIKNELCSS